MREMTRLSKDGTAVVERSCRYTWEDGKWDGGELVNDPYEKVRAPLCQSLVIT